MKTLKYSWRFLMRSKSYTIINLLGLACSLACSIILMRYIHRDRFMKYYPLGKHAGYDHIPRSYQEALIYVWKIGRAHV